MAHIITILDADWATGTGGIEPAMGKGEENEFIINYVEGIVGKLTSIDDDYLGFGDDYNFTPDSHDAYLVEIVAETAARLKEIVDEIKRISAYFSPSGDDNIIKWGGGEITPWNNYRFRADYMIFIYKSGISV